MSQRPDFAELHQNYLKFCDWVKLESMPAPAIQAEATLPDSLGDRVAIVGWLENREETHLFETILTQEVAGRATNVSMRTTPTRIIIALDDIPLEALSRITPDVVGPLDCLLVMAGPATTTLATLRDAEQGELLPRLLAQNHRVHLLARAHEGCRAWRFDFF